MRFRFLSLFILIILFGVTSTQKALAVSSDSISVSMTPENPAPGENVSITLSSYGSNLDTVSISWSVNGKVLNSGIGHKSFSLTAPAAGKESAVTATISLPDGDVQESAIVRPAMMILLWQADDSYVPPFYKGKAMPTAGSEVKIVAMPEVKSGSQMVAPSNMVYAWQQDYNNDPGASGYGKSFYTYTNDYLQDSNTIAVTATTTDQRYSSDASISVGTSDPKILFYKNDLTLGTLWEQALSNGHKVSGSEIIQAAPYFISPGDIRIPTLIWNWSINDSIVPIIGTRKNLLPLQAQAGVSGVSKINLEIDSTDKVFETATKSMNVNF